MRLDCYRDRATQDRSLMAVKPERKVEEAEEIVAPDEPPARPA